MTTKQNMRWDALQFKRRPKRVAHVPQSIAPQNANLPVGALTFTGIPLTAAPGGVSVACPIGALTFTGVAPTVAATGATTVALPVGTLPMGGLAPTVTGSGATTVALPVGTLTLTGRAPSASFGIPYVTTVSANGRYLVDQFGNPIFVQGSSPQDATGVYTPTDVATFFTDQHARGINAVQIHSISAHNSGSVNYNGDPPFTNMSTLSGTSAATDRYWAHVDSMFDAAEQAGCTIFFTVIDNITHSATIAGLSNAQATAFGGFLGARYKNRPNLVWVVGNDWQSGQWSATEAKCRLILDGIAAQGDTHLRTVWLNYTTSVSTDIVDVGGYSAWESYIDINAVYDYALPYHPTEGAYARSPTKPVIGFEWNYEGVHYHGEFGQANTTRLTVRRDAWWCVTSGATGQFFGQDNVIPANEALDLSSGALGSGYATDNAVIAQVMAGHTGWQKLVPDTGSAFATANRGTHNTADNTDPLDNDYVTAALTPDGLLAVVYISDWSSSGTLSLNIAGKIQGTATVLRYDPTTGSSVSDSAPFATPGNNAAGDDDWVLVITGTEVPAQATRRYRRQSMVPHLGRRRR